MHDDDRALARRLGEGNQRAFDEFFAAYFARLYRFVVGRVDGDEEAARDVAQETLIRALRRVDGYRGEASLWTWLCQVARSVMADRREKLGPTAARTVSADADASIQQAVEAMADEGADPEALARQGQLGDLLGAVIDALPPRYGDVLEWKYVEGVSVDGIAERLGTSQAAAQSLLQRARAAFVAEFRALTGRSLDADVLDLSP